LRTENDFIISANNKDAMTAAQKRYELKELIDHANNSELDALYHVLQEAKKSYFTKEELKSLNEREADIKNGKATLYSLEEVMLSTQSIIEKAQHEAE
jgi:hypothetical protein